MKPRVFIACLFLMVVLGLTFHCNRIYIDHQFRQTYQTVNDLLHSDTTHLIFLKVHFLNGEVAVYEDWRLDTTLNTLSGWCTIFDFNRIQIFEGIYTTPIEDIAIIETNDLKYIRSRDAAKIAVLTLVSGANIALGIYCINNPKACYGSCPTFYIETKEVGSSPRAEGFSGATAPSLIYTDIDDLTYLSEAGPFSIIMKNEALETQVIDQVTLLAVPKPKEAQILHYPNEDIYFLSDTIFPPSFAQALDGDIHSLLSQMDGREYFSPTDSNDLHAMESIIIEFDDRPEGQAGLVLNFRQTLLSTYLFYSGLDYAGNEISDHYALVETNALIRKLYNRPFESFGGIRAWFWDETQEEWVSLGEVQEYGPIARNRQLLPFPGEVPGAGPIRVRLKMAQGLWRLDYAGLADLANEVDPMPILPHDVEVIDGQPQIIESLWREDRNLWATFPNSTYRMQFNLPETRPDFNYALFLSSRGYYLEWMRDAWLENKDREQLAKLLYGDSVVWRAFAQEFKGVEATMESQFWNSQFHITQ